MRSTRFVLLFSASCLVVLSAARCPAEDTMITAKEFTQKLRQLTDDPTGPDAVELAKAVFLFVKETKEAEVSLDEQEYKWFGDPKSKQGPILLSAYIGGNTQAQLDSGHRGNDVYPGLLLVFRTYRALRAKDKDYKNEEIDKLLKLQAEGKLLKQVIEWEAKRRPKKEL